MRYAIYLLTCLWMGAAIAICGISIITWQFWVLDLSAFMMAIACAWFARERP